MAKEEVYVLGQEHDSVVLEHLVDLLKVNLDGLASDEETVQAAIDWLVMTGRISK